MSTSKGLEGIIVAETDITSIEEGKLSYVGYSIDDLADYASFEEVVYLLWHKHLPNDEALHKFKTQLFNEMTLSPSFVEQLKHMHVDNAHSMDVLRTAVSMLSLYDAEHDHEDQASNIDRSIRLQAKMAMIITTFHRLRNNLPLIEPKQELSYAENFLYMLHGRDVDPLESKAFNKALVLHADHELNASTFTARVCVATLSDLYSGLTAAISALKGPLHGGANEQVIKMLMEIETADAAIPYVKEKMANKEKIMGMGHRVYKEGDPRAKHLKVMSKEITKQKGMPQWYEMSEKIENYVKETKGLPANVDFYSASMYHALGIPHDLFTPIFAMSRTSGWIAHMLEQYANNRLIRPRAEYVGPTNQTFKPVNER